MITKSTKQKMKQILQKEEKSVFLNDIKDAKNQMTKNKLNKL